MTMPPTYTLSIPDPQPGIPPGDRWCALAGPHAPLPAILASADEWLLIAGAIEAGAPRAFGRVAFAPAAGGGELWSPHNSTGDRDHVRLTTAELVELAADVRAKLATPDRDLKPDNAAPAKPGDSRPRGVPTSAPPDRIIEAARLAGCLSPCGKSKRGAAIFDRATGQIASRGCNHLPARIACAGDDACRAACNRRCVHAETAAILDAHRDSVPGCEIVHVKVVGGVVVTSGPPSCVPCAALILRARLDAAWLLHEDGWRRYPADEFYRLSCEAIAGKV